MAKKWNQRTKPYLWPVSIIFFVIGMLHYSRILYNWEVTLNGSPIPMWISWVGMLVALLLSIQGFYLIRNTK